MVTVFHLMKNESTKRTEVAYFFFLFNDNTFHFEAKDFPSEVDAELFIKKVKLDCFNINFERFFSAFKFSEPNHEITNAIDRCKKFLEYRKDKMDDYDMYTKFVPKILPFINLLPQAVEPEEYYKAKLMVYMFNQIQW